MASFKDIRGGEWRIELDAPLVQEVEELHDIRLTDIKADPLLKLRTDAGKTVAVVYVLCRDQIEQRGIKPRKFGHIMPLDVDELLAAIRQSIVEFFPSSRADHVRAVLDAHEKSAAETDDILVSRMRKMIADKKATVGLTKAEAENEKKLDRMFPRIRPEQTKTKAKTKPPKRRKQKAVK